MASIFEKIQQFNAGRLPDMLKRKYALMSTNPFSFYRATSALFYEDLARDLHITDTTKVWSCADLHLQNFGTYRADNRLVYFDLADFDDAALLPATFDLTRMAVSIYLAAEFQKWDSATVKNLVYSFLETYKQTLAGGKTKDIDHRAAVGELRTMIKTLEKRDNTAFIQSFLDRGGKHLKTDNKKILPIDDKKVDEIKGWAEAYLADHHLSAFKKVRDAKFRVAGTSSLGLERYIVLIETTRAAGERFLLLDVKEARPSAVLPFTSIPQPTWDNEAARVMGVQNFVNDVLPAFGAAIKPNKKSFVVREMQAEQDKFDVTLPMKSDKFETILTEMAIVTASGHLRSTGRKGSSITDELIGFANQKDWKEQVEAYAKKYVKTVHTDFDAFVKAMKKQ